MKYLIIIVLSFFIVSCSSSNDVVRSGFLQKRKYKKGYNLSFKKSKEKQKASEEQLLVNRSDVQSLTQEINRKEVVVFVDSSFVIEKSEEKSLTVSIQKEVNSIEYVSVYEKQIDELEKKIKKNRSPLILEEDEKREGLNKLGWLFIVLGIATVVLGGLMALGWSLPFGLILSLVGFTMVSESKKPKKNTEAYKEYIKQKEEDKKTFDDSAHLKQQQNRLKVVKFTQVIGLLIGVFIITLPITLIFFLISLNSLLEYVEKRKNNDAEEATQEFSTLTKRIKKLRLWLYLSMVFGVIAGGIFTNTLFAPFPSAALTSLYTGIFALSWVLFLGVLIYLTILYFKLYKRIKETDNTEIK